MGLGQTTNEAPKWFPVRASRGQQALLGLDFDEVESREAGWAIVKTADVAGIKRLTGGGSILLKADVLEYATISDEVMENFMSRLDVAAVDKLPDSGTPRQAALRRLRNKKAAERRRLRKEKE
jgi:hypothetical protein